VIEQGTILDRIDYNLQQGEMYTNKGKNTLDEVNYKTVLTIAKIIPIRQIREEQNHQH